MGPKPIRIPNQKRGGLFRLRAMSGKMSLRRCHSFRSQAGPRNFKIDSAESSFSLIRSTAHPRPERSTELTPKSRVEGKPRFLNRGKKRRFLRQALDTERSRSAVSTLSPSAMLGALSLSRGIFRASDRGAEWIDSNKYQHSVTLLVSPPVY